MSRNKIQTFEENLFEVSHERESLQHWKRISLFQKPKKLIKFPALILNYN